MKTALTEEVKAKVEDFLDSLYLDVTGNSTAPNQGAIAEEYFVKLITKFCVSVATAWWSLRELFDYIQKRRLYREFKQSNESVS